MKSRRQIRRYLRRQPWYHSFRMLVAMNGRPWREKVRILLGYYGTATILEAFDWEDSVQGMHFWGQAYVDFTRWYNTDQTTFKHN